MIYTLLMLVSSTEDAVPNYKQVFYIIYRDHLCILVLKYRGITWMVLLTTLQTKHFKGKSNLHMSPVI